MDITMKIDDLLGKKAYLIDIFPKTVPAKQDNRYFEVEDYFLDNRADTDRRLTDILLKLYCYYDFTVCSWNGTDENPSAAELISLISVCFENKQHPGENISIILPEADAMIVLSGDALYMTVYNPDQPLRDLLTQLAGSQGLFFYEAPC